MMQETANLLNSSIKSLSILFSMKFKQVNGILMATTNLNRKISVTQPIDDPVWYEGTMNHFHLDDMISSDLSRKVLMDIGKGVMFVWNERIHTVVDDNVIFYLGGSDDIILRFHLERGDNFLVSPHNTGFLKRAKMAVFKGTLTGIETLFTPEVGCRK